MDLHPPWRDLSQFRETTPATVCVDRWNKPSRAGNHAPPPPDNFAVTPRFCRLLLIRRRAAPMNERELYPLRGDFVVPYSRFRCPASSK
ncbi:MAG: hypothetical protein KDJ28_18950 [Candidatus Competibacteraceae bacterium]|nr:hypothetical protein [Candidatus Competibacteraceae bacterium]